MNYDYSGDFKASILFTYAPLRLDLRPGDYEQERSPESAALDAPRDYDHWA
jgi:hypothetical protein